MGNTKTTPTLPPYPHKNAEKLWAKIKRPVAVLITSITFPLQPPPPHLSQILSSAISSVAITTPVISSISDPSHSHSTGNTTKHQPTHVKPKQICNITDLTNKNPSAPQQIQTENRSNTPHQLRQHQNRSTNTNQTPKFFHQHSRFTSGGAETRAPPPPVSHATKQRRSPFTTSFQPTNPSPQQKYESEHLTNLYNKPNTPQRCRRKHIEKAQIWNYHRRKPPASTAGEDGGADGQAYHHTTHH
jgi:hypothetical protein